jgi:hypothetical protein
VRIFAPKPLRSRLKQVPRRDKSHDTSKGRPVTAVADDARVSKVREARSGTQLRLPSARAVEAALAALPSNRRAAPAFA